MGRVMRNNGGHESHDICSQSYSGVRKKGAWSVVEDEILRNYVLIHGEGKWTKASDESGLKRSGKSCRLRWLNYLRPDIKRGSISLDEEDLIIRLHKLLGNRWSLIAGRLPGRTDNEIKNYWNTTLRKKLRLESKIAIEKGSSETEHSASAINDITTSWDEFINFSAFLQDCSQEPSSFGSETSLPNWYSQDNMWPADQDNI